MSNKVSENNALIAAVWNSLLISYIPSIYSAAYHGIHQSLRSALLISLFSSTLLTIPTYIAVLVAGYKPARFVGCVTLLYALYKIGIIYYPNHTLDVPTKALFVLLSIIVASAAVRFGSNLFWRKKIQVLLAFEVVWIIAIPMLSWIQSTQSHRYTLSVERVIKAPPKAVVILLLDELSPESVPLLYSAVYNNNHRLYIDTTKKAGKDTIYAIPSMLVAERHDEVAVCGYTSLCGKNYFDMSKLIASDVNTDVVGFYHPYCSINGLRSCWKADASQLDDKLNYLDTFILILRNLPLANYVFSKVLAQDFNEIDKFDYIRDNISLKSLTAPFWKEGGLLFIHQLLPHPRGAGKNQLLIDEYKINTQKASKFIEVLKIKLKKQFGNDYAILITTDHPLRKEFWCSSGVYADPDCMNVNPTETENIPIVVSVPKETSVEIPSTGIGLFSPL